MEHRNARCESSSDGGADTGGLNREVSAVLVLDIASSQAYAFSSKLLPRDGADNGHRAKVQVNKWVARPRQINSRVRPHHKKEGLNMKHLKWLVFCLVFSTVITLSGTAYPQGSTPVSVQVTPGEVKWMPFTAMAPGAQIAMIYGNPAKPELYVLFVKLPPNFKVLPHLHPVEQVATVLSGTVYSGLGESFDLNKLTMFPASSVYTEPLKTPHFSETKAEGVILQVTGVGPTGTQYVNPSDDPRKK
jgi:hypothetical protein